MKIDPKKSALLVIDIQNDFYADGFNAANRGKQVSQMQALPKKINSFATELRKRGVRVIFTKFVYDPKRSPANYTELIADTKENNLLCVAGSPGADLAGVEVEDGDIVLEKLSYDCFAGTDLLQLLKDKKMEDVIITGVRTEACVLATAERSFAEGFRTFVASDLVGTYDNKQQIADAVFDLMRYVGYILPSNELIGQLT
jgi:nicotinamidase-related amidase